MRQTPGRTERNRAARAAFRTELKQATQAVAAAEPTCHEQVQRAQRAIGKTLKKGLIHKNKAARHQSRLARRLARLTATPPASEPKPPASDPTSA